jgi:hypothetical protein
MPVATVIRYFGLLEPWQHRHLNQFAFPFLSPDRKDVLTNYWLENTLSIRLIGSVGEYFNLFAFLLSYKVLK